MAENRATNGACEKNIVTRSARQKKCLGALSTLAEWLMSKTARRRDVLLSQQMRAGFSCLFFIMVHCQFIVGVRDYISKEWKPLDPSLSLAETKDIIEARRDQLVKQLGEFLNPASWLLAAPSARVTPRGCSLRLDNQGTSCKVTLVEDNANSGVADFKALMSGS